VFRHFHISDIFNEYFWQGLGVDALQSITQIAEIVVIYLLLRGGLRRLVNQIILPAVVRTETHDHAHAARLKTLAGLLNSVAGYLLTFVFGVMMLRAFHLDPVPLLTTAGVAGLAVGFGAQKLVKDVISGFFILLDNQYAVGEYVTIGAVTGTVEAMGMRLTRIRDDAGRLYMISNGDISQVCNLSRGTVSTYIEVAIAADADIAKATDVIDAAGKDLMGDRPDIDFVKPPAVQGIGAMEAAKLTLRVACVTTSPSLLTEAQIALRGLVRERLSAAGIALA
jgi:small-conductance mechanosensitive channel